MQNSKSRGGPKGGSKGGSKKKKNRRVSVVYEDTPSETDAGWSHRQWDENLHSWVSQRVGINGETEYRHMVQDYHDPGTFVNMNRRGGPAGERESAYPLPPHLTPPRRGGSANSNFDPYLGNGSPDKDPVIGSDEDTPPTFPSNDENSDHLPETLKHIAPPSRSLPETCQAEEPGTQTMSNLIDQLKSVATSQTTASGSQKIETLLDQFKNIVISDQAESIRIQRRQPNPAQELDKRFKIAADGPRFFKVGRVFKTLWSEPAGAPAAGAEVSIERHSPSSLGSFDGENASQKIRLFVVIMENNGHCICLPLLTHGGQAATKDGFKPSDHAAVFTDKARPTYLRGEADKLGFKPFKVILEDRRETLDPLTRINFSKVYTVEHSIKVCKVGRISDDQIVKFRECFLKIFLGMLPNETLKYLPQPSGALQYEDPIEVRKHIPQEASRPEVETDYLPDQDSENESDLDSRTSSPFYESALEVAEPAVPETAPSSAFYPTPLRSTESTNIRYRPSKLEPSSSQPARPPSREYTSSRTRIPPREDSRSRRTRSPPRHRSSVRARSPYKRETSSYESVYEPSPSYPPQMSAPNSLSDNTNSQFGDPYSYQTSNPYVAPELSYLAGNQSVASTPYQVTNQPGGGTYPPSARPAGMDSAYGTYPMAWSNAPYPAPTSSPAASFYQAPAQSTTPHFGDPNQPGPPQSYPFQNSNQFPNFPNQFTNYPSHSTASYPYNQPPNTTYPPSHFQPTYGGMQSPPNPQMGIYQPTPAGPPGYSMDMPTDYGYYGGGPPYLPNPISGGSGGNPTTDSGNDRTDERPSRSRNSRHEKRERSRREPHNSTTDEKNEIPQPKGDTGKGK